MQMQADFSGLPVLRPRSLETTALGAAYLAGIANGLWQGAEETASLWQADRDFEPRMADAERRAKLESWRNAVARVLTVTH
jgi:glycerol kinase